MLKSEQEDAETGRGHDFGIISCRGSFSDGISSGLGQDRDQQQYFPTGPRY
jgi:hypothetical protein